MNFLSGLWERFTRMDAPALPDITSVPLAPPALKAEQFADQHAQVRMQAEREEELRCRVVAMANGRGNLSAADWADLHMIGMGTQNRGNMKTGAVETFVVTTETYEPEEYDGIDRGGL